MLEVRIIDAPTHLAWVRSRSSVSFLQTPAWAQVKKDWQSLSLGWFSGDELVGAGLVLLRPVPRFKRYLAYLPEGPDLNWGDSELVTQALDALAVFLRQRGVFQIKLGPAIWQRRWHAETVKSGIGTVARIGDLTPDEVNPVGMQLNNLLRGSGWRQEPAAGTGFGDFQPRYVFAVPLTGRTEADLLAGFNQLWRRNIKKAEKSGVTVRVGTAADMAAFHACYTETAQRDGFKPRPLSYFMQMWQALHGEATERIALYLAEHPEHDGCIAATLLVRVGDYAWYSYGASTTAARDLRPSNALQWAMLRDSWATGAAVYDLRGISDALDPNDHLFGLVQFKLGTGGYASEYVGEWDLVLRRFWALALRIYLGRR